jgi:hypothetical protein
MFGRAPEAGILRHEDNVVEGRCAPADFAVLGYNCLLLAAFSSLW